MVWTLLFLGLQVYSQIHLQNGDVRPSSGKENEWFWDTKALQIWHYVNHRWQKFGGEQCLHAEVCHELLLLRLTNMWGDEWMVTLDVKGNYKLMASNETLCFEGLIVLRSGAKYYCYDLACNKRAEFIGGNCGAGKLTQVGDQLGYCIPNHDLNVGWECKELHAWGFLAVNGKWIIPPIFDTPFTFQDGIAEVLYYGVKRKINEKGEFVE